MSRAGSIYSERLQDTRLEEEDEYPASPYRPPLKRARKAPSVCSMPPPTTLEKPKRVAPTVIAMNPVLTGDDIKSRIAKFNSERGLRKLYNKYDDGRVIPSASAFFEIFGDGFCVPMQKTNGDVVMRQVVDTPETGPTWKELA